MLSRKKRQVAVDTSFGHAYLSLCGGYHGNSERDQPKAVPGLAPMLRRLKIEAE